MTTWLGAMGKLARGVAPFVLAIGLGCAVPTVAFAQTDGQTDSAENAPPAMPPGEVVRLLDAYAVMRAQEMLGLDEQQYPTFLQRFTHLQDVRRRHQQARARVLTQLQRITRPRAPTDEAALRQALAGLKDVEARARDEVAQAVAGVDSVLTLRQQVRFRVFEELMERRKLDLMLRARQGARRQGPPR